MVSTGALSSSSGPVPVEIDETRYNVAINIRDHPDRFLLEKELISLFPDHEGLITRIAKECFDKFKVLEYSFHLDDPNLNRQSAKIMGYYASSGKFYISYKCL